MLNLITDRTAQDVARYDYFKGKKWADLTNDEKAEFLAGLKGCYNWTDFDRVYTAMTTLSNLLNQYAYYNKITPISSSVNSYSYIRKKSEIQTYLNNVSELKRAFPVSQENVPNINEWLTYEGANAIEKILQDIDTGITNMEQNWKYVGEVISGEGYFA